MSENDEIKSEIIDLKPKEIRFEVRKVVSKENRFNYKFKRTFPK